jgi:hypothetical protein
MQKRNLICTYVVVSSSVVVDDGVPPELIYTESAEDNVGVVEFVVLGDPGADESPGGLDGGVGAEAGDLLGLAAELGLGPEVAGGQLSGEGRVGLLNQVRDQMRHIESSSYLIIN